MSFPFTFPRHHPFPGALWLNSTSFLEGTRADRGDKRKITHHGCAGAQRQLWCKPPSWQVALCTRVHPSVPKSVQECHHAQKTLVCTAHPGVDLRLSLQQPHGWRIHFLLTTGENYWDQTQALLSPFPLHIPWVSVMLTRGSGPFHPGVLGQLEHFCL